MSHTQVLNKIHPRIYSKLCPNNKLSDLAELVKEWLSLERAPPVSGRAGGPRGQPLVSYPVVGRVLVDDLEALVAADIAARGDSIMGSTSTPPAVQPPPALVAPPQAVSASGGGVSAIAATPAAYGFEEGSAEAVWLRHILATAQADAAESAAMDRDQTEMHFCREEWLSVLNYHYNDDISYDEYIQCCKERGPDAADAMFVDRAQSRLPERDAFHTQELARVEAYKRGEGPYAEAATAHARKVAAFEADSASRAQLPPEEEARAAFLLAASAPCPPVVYARSPWERGCPLPARPFLGFDLECKPLGPADPDYMFVRGQLLLSVDDAFDVRVWSVRREVQEAVYKLELGRIGNEHLLWHSTRDTDPTTLVLERYSVTVVRRQPRVSVFRSCVWRTVRPTSRRPTPIVGSEPSAALHLASDVLGELSVGGYICLRLAELRIRSALPRRFISSRMAAIVGLHTPGGHVSLTFHRSQPGWMAAAAAA